MPAGSDRTPATPALPELPHTFRPLGVRLASALLGALLLLVVLVIWFAFPPEIRHAFTPLQIGTVLVLGGLFYGAGYALARSRVVARRDGVTIVNGYRVRRYEWNEILGITLRPGSPWAVVDLSNGTSVPAMGIQGSDGPRAQRQVRQLRRLVESHTA
jgi:hypothetical protein